MCYFRDIAHFCSDSDPRNITSFLSGWAESILAKQSSFHSSGSGKQWLFRAVVVVLIVVISYLVFEFGRIKGGYDIVESDNQEQMYEDRIMQLEDEIADLKQQVAIQETHRAVDKEAYKEVEASLLTLQAKIQEQNEAIGFYRGIVSPADGKAGLRVQDLKLTRSDAERQFNVRVVLIQARKHDRKVSGAVDLSVIGELNGVETTYTLAQLLAPDEQRDWPFSFRYFQDFERALVLPDGFTPENIIVQVRSTTRSIESIEQSFAWANSQG